VSNVVNAVISVSAIGLLSSLILAVAAKMMSVKTDERFEEIRSQLPGANCGACGYAGCDAYAKALSEDISVKTNLCTPGGESVAKSLSLVMGTELEDVKPLVAAVKCAGDCEKTSRRSDYRGPNTCKAASLLYGGNGTCTFGCLGYGDCAAVCPQHAISINNEVAVIDDSLCIGCKLCVSSCPKSIIEMVPKDASVFVACSSKERGAVARKKCSAGCIACKLCEKACKYDAIMVADNLASIDYSKCTNCNACVEVCPAHCIIQKY
jgi:electron transport complex protein RnfB